MDDFGISMNNNTQNEFEDVKKMNLFQRILGIIVSPAETMKNLIMKPRIIFPIVIIALGVFLVYLLNFQQYKDYLRQTMELAMQNSKAQLSPEQISTQVDIGAIFGLAIMPFSALFGWVAGTAIIFGLIKLFKGKGSFYQFLSVTGYAYVIMLLYCIISGIVAHMTSTLPMLVPITSVASLFSSDLKGNFLYGIFKGLELFAIWKIIVTGIGLTLVSKLSKTKVYSILFGIFAVQLLYTGVAEIMSSMFK